VIARTRVLVAGEGLVGNALAGRLAREGAQVIQTSRRADAPDAMVRLDLAKVNDWPDAWPDLPEVDAAVLCAAVARLGDCEADPAGSRLVNVTGTVALAERLAGQGTHVIFLSTDKVYDGTVAMRRRIEPVCPFTEYGRQKALAEEGVLDAGDLTAVLRLSKVLTPDLALLTDWYRRFKDGLPVTPFDNLYLAPVDTDLVASLVIGIIDQKRAGIFHCTGAEDRTYVDLAWRLSTIWQSDPALIEPASSPAPAAHRSRHTTLDMSLESVLFGIEQPSFEDVVDRVGRAITDRI
jgi:dTDP-4-dehydrorhamnose reductase